MSRTREFLSTAFDVLGYVAIIVVFVGLVSTVHDWLHGSLDAECACVCECGGTEGVTP